MVEILGPVRVAGEPVTSRTQLTLLCVLAAAAPRAVPFHRLIDAVWDDPPPSAENSLHSHLARLRQKLDPGSIVREGGAYRLDAPIDAVDFLAAVDHRPDDGARRATPDPTARRHQLTDLLARWRGAPYGDLAEHRFVRASADALTAAYARASHELATLLVGDGEPLPAVSLLRRLLAAEPLDEAAWAELVTALHAAGRTAEALRTVQDAVAALAEVGLEPSSRLLDAERSVLQSGPTLTSSSELPHTAGPLVGRATALATAREALATPGWVSLIGPGGVGKTRLAIEVASSLSAELPVVFCELTDTTATDVESSIARATGAPLRPPYLDRVVTALGTTPVLLVLDCCEAVASTVAAAGSLLLRGCPDLRVVATSRMPIGVGGERLVEVEPLDRDEAAQLFSLKVHDAGLSAPERDVVTQLCDMVDRLPLTIEMMAGSLRSLSEDDLIEAANDPLRVLGGPDGDLASSVRRSVDLLDDPTRRSFERLSLFHGPFVLDTAAAVMGTDEPTARAVDQVRSLRDRSLLSNVDTESGRRLHMLDTVKAVGRGDLSARRDARDAQRRFVETFSHRADRIDAGLRSRDELRWLAIARSETPDLRAAHRTAIDIGDVDAAMAIAASMFHLVYDRLRPDIAAWADETIDAFGADHRLASRVLAVAALGAMHVDDHDRAWAHVERARTTVANDDRHVELVAANLGLRSRDLLTRAAASAGDAVATARRVGDDYTATVGLVVHALCAEYAGEHDRALEIADEARRLSRRVGAPTVLAYADYAEGEILSESEPTLALDLLRRAYERATVSGSSLAEGVSLVTITTIRARTDDSNGTDRDFHAAIRYWRDLGDWNLQWVTLRNLAEHAARTGREDCAAVILGAVDATGLRAFGSEAERLDAARTQIARRVDAAELARLTAVGRALDGDELLDYALAACSEVRPPR